MRILRFIKHSAVVAGAVFLFFGVPFLAASGGRLSAGRADTVSSASVILAQPSGRYVIMLRDQLHPDGENVKAWIHFFKGEETGAIFEDIACSVAAGDAGAQEMARSLQSRLPENQMKILVEDDTLLVSRVESGKYDMMIMSEEFAEAKSFTGSRYRADIRVDLTGGQP